MNHAPSETESAAQSVPRTDSDADADAASAQALLEAAIAAVGGSPASHGVVEMIVSRPALGERQVLTIGRLDLDLGLVGDTWTERPSSRMPDRSPHPDMQLNLINARVSALIALDDDHRALAGDQFHLDLDLSEANLPPGTQLGIGTAVIEITDQPHTGCAKFSQRFGRAALKMVNSPEGKALRLRGVNARVVTSGEVASGDTVSVIARPNASAAS